MNPTISLFQVNVSCGRSSAREWRSDNISLNTLGSLLHTVNPTFAGGVQSTSLMIVLDR